MDKYNLLYILYTLCKNWHKSCFLHHINCLTRKSGIYTYSSWRQAANEKSNCWTNRTLFVHKSARPMSRHSRGIFFF